MQSTVAIKKFRAAGLTGLALVMMLSASNAFALNLTPATGGGAIAGSDAGGAFTALTGPILDETAAGGGEIGTGTIILNCPSNCIFDTGGAAPQINIKKNHTGSGVAGAYINGTSQNGTIAATSVTTTQITFTITQASTRPCTVTFQNIRVRPSTGTGGTGNISNSGTAVLAGLNGSSNYGTLVVIGSDPNSTVVASPLSVPANGTTSSTITVTLLDSNSQPVVGNTVSLAANAGTSVISAPSGPSDANGVVTFTVTNATPQTVTYIASDVTSGSVILQTTTVVFFGTTNAGTSTVSASPTTVSADGVATSTITVTLRDANSNPVIGHAVSLDQGAGSSNVSAPSGVSNASGVVTFTVTNTNIESVTYTATNTTDAVSITQTATVDFINLTNAANSTIVASPLSVAADGTTTSTITVTLRNSANAPVSGKTVSLAQGVGSSVISAPSGASDGAGVVTFSVTNITAQAVTYTATDSTNSVTITQTATVTFFGATNAAQSTVTASPLTVLANGTASSTITVTLKDVNGAPVIGHAVSLGQGGGSANISAPSGNSNNSGVVTFTVTNTTVELTTFTATDTTDSIAVTQQASVNFFNGGTVTIDKAAAQADPTNASPIIFDVVFSEDVSGFDSTDVNLSASTAGGTLLKSVTTLSPSTYRVQVTGMTSTGTVVASIPAGAATGASGATAVSTSTDNSVIFDNLAPVVTVPSNITTDNPVVTFSISATDNIDGTLTPTPSIASGSTFPVGTTQVNCTATDAAGNQGTNSFQVTVIGAASLTNSTITAAPTAITADQTSTITVQLIDANGNNLINDGGTVTLATTLGSITNVTTNGNGTYTATFNPTTTGAAVITGKLNNADFSDNATVTVSVGAISNLTSTVVATPATVQADSTSTVTVQLKDGKGNNINDNDETITFSAAPALGTFGATASNGNGSYSAVFTPTGTLGSTTITANRSGALTQTASITIVPGDASADDSVVTASFTTITTDQSSTIMVQLKDSFGNNLVTGGDVVEIFTDLGAVGPVTDFNNGTYGANFTSTSVGTAKITAAVNSAAITDDETITVNVGALSTSETTIDADPTSIQIGGTSTVTVQLKDAGGNNLDTNTDLIEFSGTGTLGTFGVVSSNGNGEYTAVFTAGTNAGTTTVSVTVNGTPMDNTVDIIITASSAADSTISVASPTVQSGGNVIVTVQAKDSNGTDITIGGDAVTLNATAGTLSNVTDNGDGTYTATLSVTSVGTVTITGTLNTVAIADNATVTVTPGAATQVAFTAQPSNAEAGVAIAPAVAVTVQDANGNTVTGSTANVSLAIGNNPASGTLSGTLTVAAVNGVATFSDLSIEKAGIGYMLMASATGLTGATSNGFNITDTTGPSVGSGIIPGTTTGVTDQPVTFTIGGGEPGVIYTFDFGDGSPIVTGNTTGSASHTFNTALTYTITVTATDVNGNVTTTTITYTVNAAVTGPTDICAGLNPIAYTALQMSAKLKFPGTLLKDSITLKATVQLNNGFNPLGQEVKWDIAGIRSQVNLDEKGNSPKSTTVKVSVRYKKPKKGEAFTARPGKVAISMKGQDLSTLRLANVTTLNADTPKTGTASTAHVCVVLTNHQAYESDKTGIYKAKTGKTGSFKSDK